MPTTESNQDLVLRFYKALDDRTLDRALNLFVPNFVVHLTGMPEPLDAAGFKQFGLSFYAAFGQGQHKFDEQAMAML